MVGNSSLAGAYAAHGAGKLEEAASICREVLLAEPENAEALNLSGVLASQQGQTELAVEQIQKAIVLRPDESSYRNNLGNLLLRLGRESEAAASYRAAIALKPTYAQAHFNLGNLLKGQKLFWEAVEEHRLAVKLKPDYAAAYNSLGGALWELGEKEQALAAFSAATELDPKLSQAHFNLALAEAATSDFGAAARSLRKVLEAEPNHVPALFQLIGIYKRLEQQAYAAAQKAVPEGVNFHYNLAIVLSSQGLLKEAVAEYRLAVEHQPGHVEAHINLGNLLLFLGENAEAKKALQAALDIRPDHGGALLNFGAALQRENDLDGAADCYRKAIQYHPEGWFALLKMAGVYRELGRMDEAVDACRAVLRLEPNERTAHSALLYAIQYHPGYEPKEIYAEHRRWSERHEVPLRPLQQPHSNDRDPQRRIRVGYVSPDFRQHCLSFLYLPLFRHHDHERFEIYFYSNVEHPDDITAQVKACADVWCDSASLTDQQLADRVRADEIDILIDLTLHLNDNRLLVFARKPAPIQVTYLGCPSTTGLTSIDYRLTDRYLDPPGVSEAFNSEELVRLPDSFWCYDPLTTEEVGPLPALENGYVTFGCLNAFCKINVELLHCWASLMAAVPHSRLLLLAPRSHSLGWVTEAFAAHGVEADRLEFVGKMPRPDYLRAYRKIDLCLDPFPYGGHTTSCDSLWMGVPMVSLKGSTVMGRAGWSQLATLDLPELVAETADEYISKAVELANDLARLALLRSTMRERMEKSPLMDGARFTRGVEAAYRQMWQRWCAYPGR